MGRVALLVGHELKLLLKDRQALGLLFLMPLAFIVFLTLALQNVYLGKVGSDLRLELVSPNCARGTLCAQLADEMRSQNWQIEIHSEPKTTPRAALSLVLPANIDKTVERLKSGQALSAEDQIGLVFDPVLDQSLRALAESHLRLALQGVLIEQARAQMQDSPEGLSPLTNVARFTGLIHTQAWGGMILPNPIQQTVPAWALFGMFFIAIPMANSMIRDRRLGVFKRLLSFPVYPAQLLLGKILPFLLLNLLQFALMLAVGVWVLPHMTGLRLDLDFNWLGMMLVTLVCALTATSYGLMVSCLTKTPEQASAFGALSVVILAILGGVMIPRFVMPPFMQSLARVSPLHWGLEAYQDLMVRRLPLNALSVKLSVLLAFSVIFLTVSRLRFRWNEVY